MLHDGTRPDSCSACCTLTEHARRPHKREQPYETVTNNLCRNGHDSAATWRISLRHSHITAKRLCWCEREQQRQRRERLSQCMRCVRCALAVTLSEFPQPARLLSLTYEAGSADRRIERRRRKLTFARRRISRRSSGVSCAILRWVAHCATVCVVVCLRHTCAFVLEHVFVVRVIAVQEGTIGPHCFTLICFFFNSSNCTTSAGPTHGAHGLARGMCGAARCCCCVAVLRMRCGTFDRSGG